MCPERVESSVISLVLQDLTTSLILPPPLLQSVQGPKVVGGINDVAK